MTTPLKSRNLLKSRKFKNLGIDLAPQLNRQILMKLGENV